MGCICSFFKTLTSYHGSHLTPKQVERQRLQQRTRKLPPGHPQAVTSSPLCMTPDKDPVARSPMGFKVIPNEEDRLLQDRGKGSRMHDQDRQGSQNSGRFSFGSQGGGTGSFERQSSFGHRFKGPKS